MMASLFLAVASIQVYLFYVCLDEEIIHLVANFVTPSYETQN
jgi:hypothetical protein